MAKVYFLFAASLVVAGMAPAAAVRAESLQSVTLQDFLPASSHSIKRFVCAPDAVDGAEVIVEYETVFSGPGQRVSKLKRMTLAGKALSADQVARINEFVGKDSITGASAGCAGKDIRVSVQVFRPNSIAPTDCLANGNHYIFAYLEGETGTVRVD